ncbi:MAG: hypothetical protein ACKO2P_04635 [Planctomycetota bacterium]
MVKVAIHQPDETETGSDAVSTAVRIPQPILRTEPSPAPPRRRRPLLKLLCLSILLVVAAPSAITLTGTARLLLDLAIPDVATAIQFEAVQLHWWSPVAISGLQLKDLSETAATTATTSDKSRNTAAQPPLAEIRRVATRQPLWQLLLNGGRGTELDVIEPRVRLITARGGTNLQETLTRLSGNSASSSAATLFPVDVRVSGGVVQCFAAAERLQHLADLEQLEAHVSTLDTSAPLPLVELAAVVREGAVSSQSDLRSSRPAERLAADLDDVIKDFPAIPLNQLAGDATSQVAGTGLLRLILKPRIDEVGRQSIQLGARDLDLALLRPLLQLAGYAGELEGRISGGVDARVAGPLFADGVAARVLLEGSGIRLRQDTWAANEWLPLGDVRATGAAALAADGLLLDELRVQTGVLQIDGSGEVRSVPGTAANAGGQAELTATLLLPQLTTALHRTLGLADDVDVESGMLRLTVRAESEDRTADEKSFEHRGLAARWHLQTLTEQLRIRRSGTLLENTAGISFEAIGLVANGLPQLRQARLTADFGVLDCAPDGAAWKVAGRFEPERLWQQLRQLTDIPQPGLTAPLSFQCRAAAVDGGVQLTDVLMTSTDLKVSSVALGLFPTALFPRNFDGSLEFRGTAAAVRTLIAPWHDAWWLASRATVEGQLSGRRTVGFRTALRIRPESSTAAATDRVRAISRTRPLAEPWSGNLLSEHALLIDEADLQLELEARPDGRQYTIQSGQLNLPGLQAKLSGGMRLEEGWVNLAVSAATRYDLAILSARMFNPQAGLRFSGAGEEVFTLSGDPAAIGVAPVAVAADARSTVAPRFTGTGAIAWDAAEFQGLKAGPAAMTLELLDDIVRSGPVQCTINGGDANLLWQYDITRGLLALGAGSRVDNLQLTEEFCRGWLGYVSPLLATAVDVQGRISARAEVCVWDFQAIENCTARGQVIIQEAAAAPGGSLTALLEIVDLLRSRGGDSAPWAARSLVLPQQSIPVRLERGWVSHDNLAVELAGYRLVSSGAVGLNQQLQLTLNVPLEKQAAGGRSVPVALRGTITAPQPDVATFLQAAGSQQLQKQLQNQVDKALNNQFKKLLGRE